MTTRGLEAAADESFLLEAAAELFGMRAGVDERSLVACSLEAAVRIRIELALGRRLALEPVVRRHCGRIEVPVAVRLGGAVDHLLRERSPADLLGLVGVQEFDRHNVPRVADQAV